MVDIALRAFVEPGLAPLLVVDIIDYVVTTVTTGTGDGPAAVHRGSSLLESCWILLVSSIWFRKRVLSGIKDWAEKWRREGRPMFISHPRITAAGNEACRAGRRWMEAPKIILIPKVQIPKPKDPSSLSL